MQSTRNSKPRIESIDILRGLIMLVMAIDHIRDLMHYGSPNPTDLATTTPMLFFTRWITHFCAPIFVFLSGISAYLAGAKRNPSALGIFLIKRGLWLITVEVVIITFAFTLNPFYNIIILQVIWAIGGSMVILGILIGLRIPLTVIGIIGALLFLGHNLLDYLDPVTSQTFLWRLLFTSKVSVSTVPFGAHHALLMIYALLPWTGVMLVGYAFGALYNNAVGSIMRKQILRYTGVSLLLLFIFLRAINRYGDPSPWHVQQNSALTVLSFLNVTKYPCSLLYLSVTIGTALLLLAAFDNVKNAFTRILIIYGKVPFFYYICHWFLIQIIHVSTFFMMGFHSSQIVNHKSPFWFNTPEYGFDLSGIYLIWMIVIFILYWPCRWFGIYKNSHKQWWLSYL